MVVERNHYCGDDLVFLGKTPKNYGVVALCDDLRGVVRSSVTKWGSRISREQFVLESPNNLHEPVGSTLYNRTGYDVTG